MDNTNYTANYPVGKITEKAVYFRQHGIVF